MSRDVIVIGAGGHGIVVADAALCAGDRVLGFLDDHATAPVAGLPILGGVADYVRFPHAAFVVAIGNAAARRQVAERLDGVNWHTVIHPTAVISSREVAVGEGTVILAGAIVNPGAQIGHHCIINTAAVVEHDDRIGNFAHVSVGARLAGTVSVGDNTWVGIGAVISNNVSVCDNCTLGAGAVVVRDIDRPGTYVGVPARKLR
ncbi:MAG: acetyltransferase [Clostridia bacterium]|nr:acetyltransferase [Clostridia bacterium]